MEAGLPLETGGREHGLNLGAEGGPKGHSLKLRRGADSSAAFSTVSRSQDRKSSANAQFGLT